MICDIGHIYCSALEASLMASVAKLLHDQATTCYSCLVVQASHPQVQKDGDLLPSFSAFKTVTLENKSRTVQDVWGLILTSLPGELLLL